VIGRSDVKLGAKVEGQLVEVVEDKNGYKATNNNNRAGSNFTTMHKRALFLRTVFSQTR
jgi:hypothetical protein